MGKKHASQYANFGWLLIKVITYPYSESELKTLKASYNVINDAYDSLGKSMELLEIVIDTYNKFL